MKCILKTILSHAAVGACFISLASAALPTENLIVNGSGEAPVENGWTVIVGTGVADQYDWDWRATGGGDDIPGFFITSYGNCRRFQTIDLLATGATEAELDAAPAIRVSEMISQDYNQSRIDQYYIKVELRGEDGEVIAAWNNGSETARLPAPLVWTEVEHVFDHYGPGVRSIYFEDGGIDIGYWAGPYGTYHDAASVHFLVDSDDDGIPDFIEARYPGFLDSSDPLDAALDYDGDGLSNLAEYIAGTKLDESDSDGDGLSDGEEVNVHFSDPLSTDTDGDGLLDGAEVNEHGSSPILADTDGDLFPDGYELRVGTSLTDATDTPGGLKLARLGIGSSALLGSDLTDPENDGSDATLAGSGFNWVSATATSKPDFGAATQGALNIFDNKIGTAGPTNIGEEKWCCDPAPQSATVEFAELTSVTHITIASGEDSPLRDPRVWEIQGSRDGVNFFPILRIDHPEAALWTERSQVLRIDLASPSLPYKFLRYAVQATGSATQHQLSELEIFGDQSNVDADGDGLPKILEDLFPFLSDDDPSDAALDGDNDGLSNLEEFNLFLNPGNPDTDGDGLDDGAEIAAGTNPLRWDSDGDGLSDADEVQIHFSNPLKSDSDDDLFSDGYEVARGSDPASKDSTPDGMTFRTLGVGTSFLIGGDFTDPENDGDDSTPAGANFNWVSISSTGAQSFNAEGSYNVFDNKVGGGTAKWCCEAAPQSITVEMAMPLRLSHFTLTSSNDTPGRDPSMWQILGSMDGVTFTPIVRHEDAGMVLWSARDQVVRFDLKTPSEPYRFFRYAVQRTHVAGMHALGEIEYFAHQPDRDGDGLPDDYEDLFAFLDADNPNDAALDWDNDGLANLQEYKSGTNPGLADSDGDGLTDHQELEETLTNPLLRDSDGDQIADGYEVQFGADPLSAASIPLFEPIVWSNAMNITGTVEDFRTQGTLVHAWTGGSQPLQVPSLGISFQPGPSLGARGTGFDPYVRSGDANYDSLLDSATSSADEQFIEIDGLIPGEEYRIQIWIADTRVGSENREWEVSTYDTSDPYVVLNSGSAGQEASKPGQFATGTFTANSQFQYVYLYGKSVSGAQYNALTVYRTSEIPAPPVLKTLGFEGTSFRLQAENLTVGRSYQLMSGDSLDALSPLSTPFTPSATTQAIEDAAPPAGRRFYLLKEVP